MTSCPSCSSTLLFRDGFRYDTELPVQRWLCRRCGYRFSDSHKSYKECQTRGNRQVCVILQEAKNLATATELKTVAGDHTVREQEEQRGKILELEWKLKNDGRSTKTISNYSQCLHLLLKLGADLNDPENVKAVIARQDHWSPSTKVQNVAAYDKFAKTFKIAWTQPKYKSIQKVPFIPLESELDALIAACGNKTSTLLQILKETAARSGEAVRLTWADIDSQNNTVTINNPEKNGIARRFQVSPKLIAMINRLPRKSKLIFGEYPGKTAESLRASFHKQRKSLAFKLDNLRLLQIHLHTFRHWKATTEYAKTKDILHVMKLLGHRKIENTLIYTQLINFESNEYHSKVAETVDEARQLIESGFEHVCDFQNTMIFRKRK